MIRAYFKLPLLKFWRERIHEMYSGKLEKLVKKSIHEIPNDHIILDAGCGEQKYKKYCTHLTYKSQDFKKFKNDLKSSIDMKGKLRNFSYPKIDYEGNIWEINEKENSFDAILCTEVFEHIPYPEKTLSEFNRLLKKGGKLILSAPASSIRHFDPYYFYSGFSDRWFEYFLKKNKFIKISIMPIGDYYQYMTLEIARTAWSNSFFSKIILLPAFIYFLTKKKTKESIDTLCHGYYIVCYKE